MYGIIKQFFKVTICDCKRKCQCPGKYYAIVKKLSIIRNSLSRALRTKPSYIFQCIISDEIDVIEVKDLCCVCFFINLVDLDAYYIAEPVNSIERE